MRMQHEYFVSKGQTFYDTMITPVLGVNTIFVYELLRRYVDRTAKGRTQVYTVVRQNFLGEMSGLARRTVNTMLTQLELAGWVKSEELSPGGIKKYVLGTMVEGQELYFADTDLLGLAAAFSTLSEALGVTKLTDIPRETRLATTQNWYLDKGCDLRSHPLESEITPPVISDHTLTRESPNKENSQKEKHLTTFGGLGPSLRSDLGTGPSKANGKNLADDVGKYPTQVENSVDAVTRKSKAMALAEAAADKAVAQNEANKRKRASAQEVQAARVEQSRQNLKGDGTAGMPAEVRSQVKAVERLWGSEIERCYPDIPKVAWSGRERGQVQLLLRDSGSSLLVENAVRYVVRNWKTLKDRYLKGKGSYPGFSFLVRFRTDLIPEAELWSRYAGVLAEWEQAKLAYKDPFDIPAELVQKYRQAKAALEQIGA